MHVKFTVNLPEPTLEALKEMASIRGTTVTEALRQVVETQRFLDNEVRKGNEILIQDPAEKKFRQVILNIPVAKPTR